MSADAWRVCPKCLDLAEQDVSSLYGKVSQEEYMDVLSRQDEVQSKETLREDYEIRTDSDGVFYVKYSCSCSVCGFKFDFKQEKTVYKKVQGE